MAKEKIRIRDKESRDTFLLDEKEWNKYGDRQSELEVLGTEEDEQADLIKTSIADSKRYDAEMAKKDKDGDDPANVAARTPPPKTEGGAAPSGLTLPVGDEAKGK